MIHALAILDSGNYAYSLCRVLEKKGYDFEIVPTPCCIAKSGCGLCIKFPLKHKEVLINEGFMNRIIVREIYKIVSNKNKKKYVKVYPISSYY